MHLVKVKILSCRNLTFNSRSGPAETFVCIQSDDSLIVDEVTKIQHKTADPVFNQEFTLQIPPTSIHDRLIISVHSKTIFGKDLIGSVTISFLEVLNAIDYDSSENQPQWISLINSWKGIVGDIQIKIGLLGSLDSNMGKIVRKMDEKEMKRATLTTTDDPSDDLYFNDFVSEQQFHEDDFIACGETVGMLLIDVISASDLPYEESAIKPFNCDPFVVVHFGKKSFRTKVIQQTRNPTWNESVYFHLKKDQLGPGSLLKWRVFDFERFANETILAHIDMSISSILEVCPKPDHIGDNPVIYESAELDIDLNSKPTENLRIQGVPRLHLKCSFLTYSNLRRNLWCTILRPYSFQDNDDVPLLDKTALVTVLDSIESNFSDETINSLFSLLKKLPTDNLTLVETAEMLEIYLRQIQRNTGKEHIIGIPSCLICKKKLTKMKYDIQRITHLAICAHRQLDRLDLLLLGGVIVPETTSAHWFTKFIDYSSVQGIISQVDNGKIMYYDRASKQLLSERIPIYSRLGMRLIFEQAGSRSEKERTSIRNLLISMSKAVGAKLSSADSVRYIGPFIIYNEIELEDVEKNVEEFGSFNEFFSRSLKSGARILCSSDDRVATSPVDARVVAYNIFKESKLFWVKGQRFSIETLLDDEHMSKKFEGGGLMIGRLSPSDYHRFHSPVNGTITKVTLIDGTFHTSLPMAVKTCVDIYLENSRALIYINSPIFGMVCVIAIGGMLVGTINVNQTLRDVNRMDELGFFNFGGSTVIVLFQRRKLQFDEDLLNNSQNELETLLRVGDSIGMSN